MQTPDGRSIKEMASIGYQGAVALTVGNTYTPQRAIGINCTVAGNVTIKLADGSTMLFAVAVGFFIFSFSVQSVTASTATATYFNLV